MSRSNRVRNTSGTKKPASGQKSPGRKEPAPHDANAAINSAILKTSRALWFTGLPTVFFIVVIIAFSTSDPKLQSSFSSEKISVLVNKWLYYSYFSIAAITLFKIFDDYGHVFLKRKLIFALYLMTFLGFANTLISALLEEVGSWQEGAKPVTSIGLMTAMYAGSVLALFGYLMLREAELSLGDKTGGRTTNRISNETSDIPLGEISRFFAVVGSQAKYWLIPIGVAMALGALLVFGLPTDSWLALYVFSTMTCMGVTFPVWQRFRP